jgi:hypothetical protein
MWSQNIIGGPGRRFFCTRTWFGCYALFFLRIESGSNIIAEDSNNKELGKGTAVISVKLS